MCIFGHCYFVELLYDWFLHAISSWNTPNPTDFLYQEWNLRN